MSVVTRELDPDRAASALEASASPGRKLFPPPEVGFTIAREFHFSSADISAIANLITDLNPLHHEGDDATGFDFDRVIVTGAHSTSVMMGSISTGLTEFWPNIGLGYSARFRRAILAGETVQILWRIVSIKRQEKLKGLVLEFEGTLSKADGEIAIHASCDTFIPDSGYL